MFIGAEAVLRREGGIIIKERVSKGYRIPFIDDKLRKYRTRREAKLLLKCLGAANVPKVLDVSEYLIRMEFIDGKKLSSCLDEMSNRKEICFKIGEEVCKMHNIDVIHGDLTTSNMILKEGKIFFIDFGLGFVDAKDEHKAVDIHLFRQALESKHSLHFDECFDAFLKGYKNEKVLKRLEVVEKRGRYKRKTKK